MGKFKIILKVVKAWAVLLNALIGTWSVPTTQDLEVAGLRRQNSFYVNFTES